MALGHTSSFLFFQAPKGQGWSSFTGAGSKAHAASLATLCYTVELVSLGDQCVARGQILCVLSPLSANKHWPAEAWCDAVWLWDLVHLSLHQMALPCLSTLAQLVIFCPGAQPDHSVKLQRLIYHHSGGVFVQSVLQLLCIVADKVDSQVVFFFWSKNKTYLVVIKISLCSFALIPTDDMREKWQFCFRKQTWLCEKRFGLLNQRICVEERWDMRFV